MAKEQYIKRQCVVNYTFNIHKRSGVKLDNDHEYIHITQLVGTSCEVKVTIL